MKYLFRCRRALPSIAAKRGDYVQLDIGPADVDVWVARRLDAGTSIDLLQREPSSLELLSFDVPWSSSDPKVVSILSYVERA